MQELFEKIKDINNVSSEEQGIATSILTEHDIMQKTDENHGVRPVDENIEREVSPEKPRVHIVVTTDMEPKTQTEIPDIQLSSGQEIPEYYIVSDSKIANVLGYQKIVEDFMELASLSTEQFRYCQNMILECDKEVQDYLHELRMPQKSKEDAEKMYRLGHYLQIKRQGYKMAMGILKPLARFMETDPEEKIKALSEIVKYLKINEEIRSNSIYMQKSNLMLPVGDKFRSLPEHQQNVVRKNYKKS